MPKRKMLDSLDCFFLLLSPFISSLLAFSILLSLSKIPSNRTQVHGNYYVTAAASRRPAAQAVHESACLDQVLRVDPLEGPTPVASRCTSPAPKSPTSAVHDPLDGDTPVASPVPTRSSSPALEEKPSRTSAKTVEQQNDTPSEFSVDALLTVAGATLLMFVMFGFSNSAGVFQSWYASTTLRQYEPATISWIGSTHLMLCFASGLVSGPLFDRGWYRLQLIIGSIGWIVCLFLLSISRSYLAIIATQGIGLGLSLGLVFAPTLAVVGLYFQRNRASMLGIVAAGGGVGSICYPIMLNAVLPKLGFGLTVRIVAFVSMPLLAIANFVIRPRTPVRPPIRQSFGKILGNALSEKQTWAVCIGIAGGMCALFTCIFYVQVFFDAQPLPETLAKNCLAILQAFAVLGRLSGGRLADRFGVWRTVVPACFSTGAATFLLLASSNTAAAIIFLIIFGSSSGILLSVTPGCFMRLSPSPSEIGMRSGLGFCFVALAALISSPIAGSLLVAAHGAYIAPVAFAGGMGIVGSSIVVLGSKWLASARMAAASSSIA